MRQDVWQRSALLQFLPWKLSRSHHMTPHMCSLHVTQMVRDIAHSHTNGITLSWSQVDISGRTPSRTAPGGYQLFSIPISEFGCKDLNAMNKVDFMVSHGSCF